MRLEIHFRHMDRSEPLEALVTTKVSHAVEGFLHRHDAHIQVWLISDLNLTTRGTGEFCCEIEIRYPKKKQLFIQKKHIDMHNAIQEATDTLGHLLDEAGKREIDHRKARETERAARLATATNTATNSDSATGT